MAKPPTHPQTSKETLGKIWLGAMKFQCIALHPLKLCHPRVDMPSAPFHLSLINRLAIHEVPQTGQQQRWHC